MVHRITFKRVYKTFLCLLLSLSLAVAAPAARYQRIESQAAVPVVALGIGALALMYLAGSGLYYTIQGSSAATKQGLEDYIDDKIIDFNEYQASNGGSQLPSDPKNNWKINAAGKIILAASLANTLASFASWLKGIQESTTTKDVYVAPDTSLDGIKYYYATGSGPSFSFAQWDYSFFDSAFSDGVTRVQIGDLFVFKLSSRTTYNVKVITNQGTSETVTLNGISLYAYIKETTIYNPLTIYDLSPLDNVGASISNLRWGFTPYISDSLYLGVNSRSYSNNGVFTDYFLYRVEKSTGVSLDSAFSSSKAPIKSLVQYQIGDSQIPSTELDSSQGLELNTNSATTKDVNGQVQPLSSDTIINNFYENVKENTDAAQAAQPAGTIINDYSTVNNINNGNYPETATNPDASTNPDSGSSGSGGGSESMEEESNSDSRSLNLFTPFIYLALLLLELLVIFINCLRLIMAIFSIQSSSAIFNDDFITGFDYIKSVNLPMFGISLYQLLIGAAYFCLACTIIKVLRRRIDQLHD